MTVLGIIGQAEKNILEANGSVHMMPVFRIFRIQFDRKG